MLLLFHRLPPDSLGLKPILPKLAGQLSQASYTPNPYYYAKLFWMTRLHAAFGAGPKVAERSSVLGLIIIRIFIAYDYIFFNVFYS